MSTQIYYNNQLAVPTGQPIPLFGITDNMIRYGNRWADVSHVTLHGQISGCTYDSIISAKNKLEQIYSSDFKSLTINQDGTNLYQSDYNRILNIDFQDSKYVGLLDYTISFESYPVDLFSGFYGVLDPINEWSFNEQENKLLEVTHKISARGINTSSGYSNAFDNCKNYVLGLTGSSSFVTPYFINYCTGIFLCVDTWKESINRMGNTYSIEEKYILDLYNGEAGYIRYSSEYECDINKGIASLNINGEVKSCRNADLQTLRNKYSRFDVYSAAVQSYVDASNKTDLNPNYLSSGISEDNYNKKISFNVQFDNDFTPKTYFDYATDIKVDENDITTVDIKGVIKSRGNLESRWENVQFYYNNELNLFYLANQAYSDFENQIYGKVLYSLNPIQENYSISKNPFIAEISVSTSYNNEDIFPPDFKYLDYTLGFKPAIEQIQSMPLVNLIGFPNQDYYTVDLSYLNRASLELKGHAVAACSGTYHTMVLALKNLANYNILTYGNQNRIFLDKNSVTSSNNFQGKDAEFDFVWSFDSPAADSYPFRTVDTLSLTPTPIFSLIAHIGNVGTTSSAIDTTGSNLLIIAVGGGGEASVSDSFGNVWNLAGFETLDATITIFYCKNPIVGIGHVFTNSVVAFPSMCVAAFAGASTDPFDNNFTSNGIGGSTVQPGSITPSSNNALIITALQVSVMGMASIDSGFSIIDQVNGANGVNYGSALAYKIQTMTEPENPTWSVIGSPSTIGAAIISFKS